MNEKPAPQVLWSWMTAVCAAAIPATGLLCWLLWLFLPAYLPILLVIWSGTLLLLLGVYLPLRRRSLSFSLEQEQIIVTGGVVFATTRRMRIDAVRQVTLLQGPLERRHDTAFLLVSATGGHLLIEGIDRQQAEDWCRRLAPR